MFDLFELKTFEDVWRRICREIHDQREEILKAFVAKYGCGPEEAEQVTQFKADGTILYYVRRKLER